VKLIATPWQTVGPFFHIGCTQLDRANLTAHDKSAITIEGRILDGDGKPVPDAMIEIWQANAAGRYPTEEEVESFRGYGRAATDAEGRFRFRTTKPGRVPFADSRQQAPHLAASILMRGLLKRLVTRMYFPDEPANAEDPVLSLVDSNRKGTLIAKPVGAGHLSWDVVLQGNGETVFFDL